MPVLWVSATELMTRDDDAKWKVGWQLGRERRGSSFEAGSRSQLRIVVEFVLNAGDRVFFRRESQIVSSSQRGFVDMRKAGGGLLQDRKRSCTYGEVKGPKRRGI